MSKLYVITRPGFKLPYASEPDTRQVLVTPADKLPCMFWPNGRCCFAVNLYLLELYDQGLSRLGVGGTIATYASNIGHLVRFCFDRGVDFHDLTDGQFTLFIRELRDEVRDDGESKRSDSHVLVIARNCLDFLEFLALDREDKAFLGRHGRIKAYKRWRRAQDKPTQQWHHASFPTPDPKKRRHPIRTDHLEAIRNAVLEASSSVFQRRRRYVMIRCLEITGGRRIEIANLRVVDVVQAINSPIHELQLMTAKRRGRERTYRKVPCAKADLLEIWNFIRTARRSVVSRTIGVDKDHGYVFINERSGKPLQANTITQEISTLARSAGIEIKVSPHMFRHRFITKIFVSLIRTYDFENPTDLRRALIGVHEIKQRLIEWTGHLSTLSLDRYIDMAFVEVEGLRVSMDSIKLDAEVEAIRSAIRSLANELIMDGEHHIAERLSQIVSPPPVN